MSAAAHVVIGLEQLQSELAREARDPAFGTAHATIGIGPIDGGTAVNIVPDRCTLRAETRVLPGQDLNTVERRIAAVAAAVGHASGAELEVTRVAGYPSLAPPAGTGAAARFAGRIERIAGRGGGGAVDFGTEAGLYQQRLGVPVVVCGPGSMAQGHVADEFLEVGELAAAQAFVAGVVRELGAPR